MANYNSPRYQRHFVQEQTTLLAFNNSGGTWDSTGAQMIRMDQGSVSITRNAPYSRFPVLTGTKSEVAGIRGRKGAAWAIRGMPMIPSGVSSQVPDMDIILRNIFGQPSSGGNYTFLDSGYLPFSLLSFVHGIPTLTARATWGCFVTRAIFHFNGPFLTVDLEGFGGYPIDSTGFSVFDSQAKAGLSTFPTEPVSPSVSGQPIAGFGNGYTASLHSQNLELKVRVLDITLETGYVPINDVYGSPYLVAAVGDARRASIRVDSVDDDTSQLNDLKTQADTDNVTIDATVLAGNVANSKFTFNLKNIQPNAFNLKDNGPVVEMELPESFAHATAIGAIDDFSLSFS